MPEEDPRLSFRHRLCGDGEDTKRTDGTDVPFPQRKRREISPQIPEKWERIPLRDASTFLPPHPPIPWIPYGTSFPLSLGFRLHHRGSWRGRVVGSELDPSQIQPMHRWASKTLTQLVSMVAPPTIHPGMQSALAGEEARGIPTAQEKTQHGMAKEWNTRRNATRSHLPSNMQKKT